MRGTVRATRVGNLARVLSDEWYVCQRCGIEKRRAMGRPKPRLCQDCVSVTKGTWK